MALARWKERLSLSLTLSRQAGTSLSYGGEGGGQGVRAVGDYSSDDSKTSDEWGWKIMSIEILSMKIVSIEIRR